MSPRVKGPLLSLEAHGTLHKLLTFQTHHGRSKVYPYTIPTDTQSQSQLNQRAHFLDASRFWQFIGYSAQAAWNQSHIQDARTGYNLFNKTIIMRETVSPSWTDPTYAPRTDVINDLIALFPFENPDGSTYRDISGNALTFSPTNATFVQGKRGHAVSISTSTTNNFINHSRHIGSPAALSLACLFYSDLDPEDQPGYYGIISNTWQGGGTGFTLNLRKPGFRLLLRDSSQTAVLNTPTPYVPGVWNSIIATSISITQTVLSIYLNGNLIASSTFPLTYPGDSSNNIYIGSEPGSPRINATLDNVAILKGLTNATRI